MLMLFRDARYRVPGSRGVGHQLAERTLVRQTEVCILGRAVLALLLCRQVDGILVASVGALDAPDWFAAARTVSLPHPSCSGTR